MLKQFLVTQASHAIPHYRQFEVEARNQGARFIEAEHMLLALAASAGSDAGRLLIESGLDHDELAAALRAEHRQSLAFAGVQAPAEGLAEAADRDRHITLGTSAKAALARALHARHRERPHRGHRGHLRDVDVLIGILQAELGTVPRAVAIAGVDRAALIARARGVGVSGPAC
jgi:ATP-dependent Clp protease ATP-binding subunit ClpA